MKIPGLEGHRRVFYHGEKTPTDSALWWQTWWTYTSWGERRWSSRQHFLLQVNVLGGAGVLQMFLVVFLEGSSTEKTDESNDQPASYQKTVVLLLVTDCTQSRSDCLLRNGWSVQTQRMRNQNNSRANMEPLSLNQRRVIDFISSALVVGSIPAGWEADGWKQFCPSHALLPALAPSKDSVFNYSNPVRLNQTWVSLKLLFNLTHMHAHKRSKCKINLDHCSPIQLQIRAIDSKDAL